MIERLVFKQVEATNVVYDYDGTVIEVLNSGEMFTLQPSLKEMIEKINEIVDNLNNEGDIYMSEKEFNEQEAKEQLDSEKRIKELEDKVEIIAENVSGLFDKRWHDVQKFTGLRERIEIIENQESKFQAKMKMKAAKRFEIISLISLVAILFLAIHGIGALVSMIWR